MRKLHFIEKEKCDIIVIDETNVHEWAKYVIPENANYKIVKTSNHIPVVKSFRFYLNLFKFLWRYGINGTSLIASILTELKPKVVLTWIDNNSYLGPVQTLFPDVLCISIQNGIRLDNPFTKSKSTLYGYPEYYGFGDHEKDWMHAKKSTFKRFYSVGSLKMGIFLQEKYNAKDKKKINISFISEYADVEAQSTSRIHQLRTKAYLRSFKLLEKFSQINGFLVNVAMRAERDSVEYVNELKFYNSNSSLVNFIPNNRQVMSSYQVGMDSDMVVSFDSTLMFELFGAKKKVLCCGYADEKIIEIQESETQFSNLPNELVIKGWEYEEFEKKMLEIMQMKKHEYELLTSEARAYYMNFVEEFPHEILRNRLSKKINY